MLENKLIGTISIGAPVRQGEKGEIGPQGPRGEKGEIGPQGPRGEKGEKGATGEKGETGAEGKQGPKGDRGEQGERGPKGETGLIGPTGHIGPQGERGIQGPRGEQGPQGKQGERGPQGIQGAKGEKGEQGIKGERGEKGEQGEPGKGADIIFDNEVSKEKTWSSNKILEAIFKDDTWEEIKGTTIEDSKNGYIKGLEIEGQTLKNITGISFKDKREFSEFSPKANLENGYIKINSADVAIISTKPFNIDKSKEYTLILDFKFSSDFNSDSMDRDRFLLNDGAKSKEYTFTTPIQYSYNELKTMSSPIKIKLTNNINDNQIKSGLRGYFYDVKQGYIKFRYMILEGDYTQKDVPDFIEGVQGVGLKTEKGYKIGINTHGKNLLNINNVLLQQGYNNVIENKDATKVVNNKLILKKANSGYHMKIYLEKGKTYKTTFTKHKGIINIRIFKQNDFLNGIISDLYPVKENFTYTHKHNAESGIYHFRLWAGEENATIENLQLEENTQATKYQPYKESTSEIILDRQLNTGDKLTYDNTKGKYIITLANKDVIDTEIKTELLPQTYKTKTYISVDSGVSGILKGQYPKDTTKEEIKQILQELGVIENPPTTLEEMEADEPTTLEELTDEPTTLEE